MLKKSFRDYLTPEEHLNAIKAGMVYELKKRYPGDHTAVVKAAASLGDLTRAAVAATVLFGVPLGIAAHHVGVSTAPGRQKERELQERIKFYKGLTTRIESSLAEHERNRRRNPNLNINQDSQEQELEQV